MLAKLNPRTTANYSYYGYRTTTNSATTTAAETTTATETRIGRVSYIFDLITNGYRCRTTATAKMSNATETRIGWVSYMYIIHIIKSDSERLSD